MKKAVLSQVLFLASSVVIFAQTHETVRIKAGENPETSYSPQGFYRFVDFQDGFAYLKNGEMTKARFNYHILNQEMQFISSKGDTLALADPFSLKYITIDTNVFYYSQGYIEVLVNQEPVKLARKLRLDVRAEKIGAYGQASPSGSIRTPNRLVLGTMGKDLSINQDLVIQKHYSYYWLDKYSTILKATKANLFKLLDPDKKAAIEEYLKRNKVEFHNEEDLKKLIDYSSTIK